MNRLRAITNEQWTAICALFISLLTYVYFAEKGSLLMYKDAISHLEISRRIIDSSTRGFGQLGGVWPPLPHLLALPLIGIDRFYCSGFAGSIVSMISYVIATVLIFKIVKSLTQNAIAAGVGAAVFALNPNVLYMQAAPMTEMLLYACMLGAVYGLQRWIQTDNYRPLLGGAAAILLATLTRYEAWVLFGVLVIIVLLVSLTRHGWKQMEGMTITFGLIGGLGIVGWVVWNLLIFGDAMNFQTGEYAKPSLWVGSDEAAIGNWGIASRTYWYATVQNVGIVVIIAGALGLLLMAIHYRLRAETWPTLSFLVFAPFFVLAIQQGQRPLHVEEITGSLYNVRFGLVMILPAAIGVGVLVSLIPRRILPIVGAVVAVAILGLNAVWFSDSDDIVTLREPVSEKSEGYYVNVAATADYLETHFTDGLILMESFGNELILFEAGISFSNNIYEGSYLEWEPALQDPIGSQIDWIVIRGGDSPDEVHQALYGTDKLATGYMLVYEDDLYQIYERKE